MKDEKIIIKKYSNRRLYNTQTSTYITLDDVRDMVRKEAEFEVRDAKTEEDLTRQVLTQIIFEQELNGAHSMLPTSFLKHMIGLYDNNMREVFPHYLHGSMEAFMANQEKIKDQFATLWGGYNPLGKLGSKFSGQIGEQIEGQIGQLEEITAKNMEIMQQAMQLFNPFEYMGKKKD